MRARELPTAALPGGPWAAIARELARNGYVTRSGRPWTLWNVRSAYSTAAKHGTINAPDGHG